MGKEVTKMYALISPDHEMLDKIEAQKGRNTMVPLAFDILEATRQKMADLGRFLS